MGKNEKKAFFHFRAAALKGCAEAMNNLGYCFRFGRGVRKNEKKAFGCFRAAARRGCVGAQYNLGLCYAVGSGVEQNDAEAHAWLRRAAEGGNEAAIKMVRAFPEEEPLPADGKA